MARRAAAALAVGAAASSLLPRAAGCNASSPHPHSGLLPRLELDPRPMVSLSASDLAQIEQGGLWTRTAEVSGFGRSYGVQDIAAPREVVWNHVVDLSGYVGKVPKLRSLNVYSSELRANQRGLQEVIEKAVYKVNVLPGYEYEYFVEHHASPAQGTLVFFLDYERCSSIDDMMGKWYLQDHPTKLGWTRVFYQLDLKPWGYVPSVLKSFAASRGLHSTIGWVKAHSERPGERTVTAGVELAAPPRGPLDAAGWLLVVLACAAAAATAIAERRGSRSPAARRHCKRGRASPVLSVAAAAGRDL